MRKIFTLFLLLASANAFAGGYVMLGAGNMWGNASDPTIGISDSGMGIAYTVIGGYQFNRFAAVEAEYTNFGSMSVAAGGNVSAYAAGVAAVGLVPVSSGVSLFCRVGAADTLVEIAPPPGASMLVQTTQQKTAPFFGVGFQITDDTDTLGIIRVSYSKYAGGNSGSADSTHVNLGALLLSAGIKF